MGLLALVGLRSEVMPAEPPAVPPVLPYPAPPFGGVIGRTMADSKSDFPQPVPAPKGAPNILLVMTDDGGFGASSTFGDAIPTPTFDKLAARGLKYNRFHTTALCSPTRAALISGRNHHNAHTGIIMERSLGFPGYDSVMPKSCGTVAEVLKQNGYNTAWFGKNHNVPGWQSSAAGPFDLWATTSTVAHASGSFVEDENGLNHRSRFWLVCGVNDLRAWIAGDDGLADCAHWHTCGSAVGPNDL